MYKRDLNARNRLCFRYIVLLNGGHIHVTRYTGVNAINQYYKIMIYDCECHII